MLSTACCCPVSGQTMCSYKTTKIAQKSVRSVRGD